MSSTEKEKFAEYSIEMERLRNNLATYLRAKGIDVAQNATLQTLVPLVNTLPVRNAEETFTNGTMSSYVDETNTSIRPSFFRAMTSLQSAEITKATYIGSDAFMDCSNLVSIKLNKITFFNDNLCRGCNSLQYVYAPLATNWGSNVFRDLMSIKHFITPSFTGGFNISGGNNSLLTIFDTYSSALQNTYPQLTLLIMRKTDGIISLSSANNIHGGDPDGVEIYVPQDLVDGYKAASNWSTFASCIKPLEGSDYEEIDWYENSIYY